MQRSRFFHFIRQEFDDVKKLKDFVKHPDVLNCAYAHHKKRENCREHWHFCFELKYSCTASELELMTGVSIEDNDFSRCFEAHKKYLILKMVDTDILVVNGKRM